MSATLLTACAEETETRSLAGVGPSVPYGATKAQYQAAFRDVPPITLTTQSPSPKGSPTGKNVDDYLNAVTEWSGGKITFEIAYSNGIAPPEEVDDALRDGRLDLGHTLPIYEPSEYPANAALIRTTFLSEQTPVVGPLQSNAWPNEVAFTVPEIMDEFRDHGMEPLIPQYDSGANVMFCSDRDRNLAAFHGRQAASGGQAQTAAIESLGGSAVSVPYTELFEGLERGVVDCSVSSLIVGVLGGFISAAPHITVDPTAGMATAPGSMVMSSRAWDRLPTAARQLLWDRLDVFMTSNIDGKIWPNSVAAIKAAKAAGGTVAPYEPDARRAINEANARLLREVTESDKLDDPEALVAAAKESSARWLRTVREDGIDADVTFAEFDTWYEPGKVDLDAFIDHVFAKVFLPHRPS
ncbi:TRAP transporter substrate-binding protein DctP [Actinomadura algeriensis]|uniref:TRAP-type C4-dicarboxylate transport system substrate-binding protein n=1 Tax=Actinomadura algeriensis TaxID=1679523 RepID=A0ABR9K2N9_9ACTN|nr:TRAP transporter substrate-binding protein DctP [Actinomadura algeriensis]MBE1536983.1 TRAP-type C4-dicarboxylate transport system substrate-binding protein [Actinomadura algeriensis]